MAEEMLEFEDDELVFKYLTFRVSKKVYAVDVSVVAEISQRCELLPIPEFPDYIMGLAQIKGENVPVINPHARFQDKDPNPDDDQKCIVVVENEAEDKAEAEHNGYRFFQRASVLHTPEARGEHRSAHSYTHTAYHKYIDELTRKC